MECSYLHEIHYVPLLPCEDYFNNSVIIVFWGLQLLSGAHQVKPEYDKDVIGVFQFLFWLSSNVSPLELMTVLTVWLEVSRAPHYTTHKLSVSQPQTSQRCSSCGCHRIPPLHDRWKWKFATMGYCTENIPIHILTYRYRLQEVLAKQQQQL